ncbi:MAG: hypothetical protein U0670_23595 [Anaerolineae bacterium]
MTRIEDAIQQISEDIGWREDLIDSEADAVMKWVESKLAQADAQATTGHDFHARVQAIRDLLTHINRFVGKRPALTPEEQQSMLDRMADSAQVMPIKTSDLDTKGFSAQAAGAEVDNLPLIGALTTWLDGGELPTAPVDDGRADTGLEAQAAPAEPPPAAPPVPPPPPADPAALSAILGFFNTAPTDPPPDESATQSPTEDTHDLPS